jgi:probable DNA metabolism protein
MVDYLYDGTFEGFLTCVYSHYYDEKANGIFPADRYQSSLLANSRLMATDQEKADRVYAAIMAKISEEAIKRIFYVFLSSNPDKDNIAFRYLLLGFRMGGRLSSLHSHPVVFEAQTVAKKVAFEVHRLTGLIRFSSIKPSGGMENGEILYAKIEPDHDVLELLGEHFADRFRYDPFIIHDAKREKALFCQNGEWVISPLPRSLVSTLSETEEEYRRLWKLYFESIAIGQRTNPRCQRNFMPVRYWKNLTEFSGPVAPG